MRDAPGQLTLFAPVTVIPRGDGTFVLRPEKPQQWLSTRAAARLCGISQDTIARWARDGRITARRMGPSHYQIAADSLRKFLEPMNHLQ
jgi:excisionase family DNA binding protein